MPLNDFYQENVITKDLYKVLLFEDDIEQVKMITEFLRLSGPFQLLHADSIEHFWELIQIDDIDVLLLDYRLPDGTGLEVLSQLPIHGYDIPAIMVTGQGDEQIAVQSIQQGALEYVVKGKDYLIILPSKIKEVYRSHQLQKSILRTTEQIQYQAFLLDNVRDAIVVWNLDGVITYWNHAAQRLFGWEESERLGLHVDQCYLSMFKPKIDLPLDDGMNESLVERQYTNNDENTAWFSSRVTALQVNKSKITIIGYMDVVRDITERKHLQALIQKTQTLLAQASRLAAIGEIAAGVAHQLSSPLTSVIAESQLLLHCLSESDYAYESAKAIEEAGWKVQEAVQRLSEFPRPASDTLQEIDVNETINLTLSLVGDQIIASGVNIEVSIDDQLGKVHGNSRQLVDLWVNLLLILRDSSLSESATVIRIGSQDKNSTYISIKVSINGTPFSAEKLESIFEPDFVGSTRGRGDRMELSICRDIVRQHDGRIDAEISAEHGTIFEVILPNETNKR